MQAQRQGPAQVHARVVVDVEVLDGAFGAGRVGLELLAGALQGDPVDALREPGQKLAFLPTPQGGFAAPEEHPAPSQGASQHGLRIDRDPRELDPRLRCCPLHGAA